ncbi:MAG: hypothetical protein OXC10_07605 [Rhodospirillaceae bacterium]|nr:hypothetical protein [Rhodospirillaceae bacterium]
MAAYEKLAVLAYALYQRTKIGRVNWEVTVSDGVYQASFSDYSIKISLQVSQRDQSAEDVKISVIGDEGNEIESFTDEDIQVEWLPEFSEFDNCYQMMYQTYEIARRSALGTEKAIDQLLSELEG